MNGMGTDEHRIVHTFSECGCSAEVREEDSPVFGILCIHGGYQVPANHGGQIKGSILIAREPA